MGVHVMGRDGDSMGWGGNNGWDGWVGWDTGDARDGGVGRDRGWDGMRWEEFHGLGGDGMQG